MESGDYGRLNTRWYASTSNLFPKISRKILYALRRASCRTFNLEDFYSPECTQERFLAWSISFARTSEYKKSRFTHKYMSRSSQSNVVFEVRISFSPQGDRKWHSSPSSRQSNPAVPDGAFQGRNALLNTTFRSCSLTQALPMRRGTSSPHFSGNPALRISIWGVTVEVRSYSTRSSTTSLYSIRFVSASRRCNAVRLLPSMKG